MFGFEARDASTKQVMDEDLVVGHCTPDTELLLEHALAPIERIFDGHMFGLDVSLIEIWVVGASDKWRV
jgi:hypothetical protein